MLTWTQLSSQYKHQRRPLAADWPVYALLDDRKFCGYLSWLSIRAGDPWTTKPEPGFLRWVTAGEGLELDIESGVKLTFVGRAVKRFLSPSHMSTCRTLAARARDVWSVENWLKSQHANLIFSASFRNEAKEDGGIIQRTLTEDERNVLCFQRWKRILEGETLLRIADDWQQWVQAWMERYDEMTNLRYLKRSVIPFAAVRYDRQEIR